MAPQRTPLASADGRSTYVPAIDGLRALAIAAVVLYHLNLPQIPGGFLGVDVFFVISGYVITRVLLDALTSPSGLDLRAFALARLRRLAPALVTLLFVFGFIAGIWQREVVARFAQDVPAALLGMENWALVWRNADYFTAMARPSLLQHTWSLAIEAQFYAVWPLVLMAAFRRGGRRAVQRAALTGTALSMVALLLFYAAGAPISHLYYGTDTHAMGLLLGCALAVYWGPERLGGPLHRKARAVIDGLGALAVIGLLLLFLLVQGEASPMLRWALILAALATSLLIAVLVHPQSRLATAFAVAPLRWLGTRSYGIYLWHWPVFQIMRPGLDLQGSRLAINLVSTAIVLLVAEVSYRVIETPFRYGRVTLRFSSWRHLPRRVMLTRTGVALSLVTLWGVALVGVDVDGAGTESRAPASSPVSQVEPMPQAADVSPTAAAKPTSSAADDAAVARTYDVFGDSVLLGAKAKLADELHLGLYDAQVGRQADALLEVLQSARIAESHAVILNLGNNGYAQRSDVRTMLQLLAKQPRVILINTAVDRIWREHNNDVIADLAAVFPNVRVADWQMAAAGHPEFFVSDGVHLSRSGIRAYSTLVLKAIALP